MYYDLDFFLKQSNMVHSLVQSDLHHVLEMSDLGLFLEQSELRLLRTSLTGVSLLVNLFNSLTTRDESS